MSSSSNFHFWRNEFKRNCFFISHKKLLTWALMVTCMERHFVTAFRFGCHRKHLALDEALHSVYQLQNGNFCCLWRNFENLFENWGKTTGVALVKALECLVCDPRMHLTASTRHACIWLLARATHSSGIRTSTCESVAVIARHFFKHDHGLLRESCASRSYTFKFIVDICCHNLYSFFVLFCFLLFFGKSNAADVNYDFRVFMAV